MFSIDYLYTIKDNFAFVYLEKDSIKVKSVIKTFLEKKKTNKGSLYLFVDNSFENHQDEHFNIFCYKYFDKYKNNFAKFQNIRNLDIK